MAVKVVAKQVMCPKCFETLEYTTQDVIKVNKVCKATREL